MKYRKLKRADLEISEITFGCMSLGEDHKANAKLLHQALDLGINLFDTADLYQKGANEESVGLAFKGMRKDVLIATKVGNQLRKDGSGWDWNPTKTYILKAVEDSLCRLQTDYIDLYQLHGGTIDDPIDETIEAFEILKQKGMIRHYGISSIRPNVIREYVARSSMVSVMMQYSLLDRRPEEECLPLLQENGIGVIVRGGLAKGLLAGKPATNYLNWPEHEVASMTPSLAALALPERSEAQTALKYPLAHESVTTIAVGIRTLGQLNDVAATPGAPDLDMATIKGLRASFPANHYSAHR